MNNLAIGLSGTASETVLHTNTAAALGSGNLDVYATPAMVALMEKAACVAINTTLEEGTSSVGVALNITHTKASKVGHTITASALLTGIEGPKLTFMITAKDGEQVIGMGEHTRYIINIDKFLSKL